MPARRAAIGFARYGLVIVGFDTLRTSCTCNALFIQAASASQVFQTGEPGYGEAQASNSESLRPGFRVDGRQLNEPESHC
jgi:hypothetical protein